MTERSQLVTTIRPRSAWGLPALGEAWAHRELLYRLVERDVKVRYKQTLLGAAWAVLQPVATMVVFTIFFGRLAGIPSDDTPYWLFALAGLVPWTFFATGMTQSALSLVTNASIVTKVWFPRVLVPTAAMLAAMVDLAISVVFLLLAATIWGGTVALSVAALPAFVVLALATGFGVGALLAALNVLFRDVRYVLPFLVQLWLFVTPIAYPASLVPERWRTVYALNPMATVVEGFRWGVAGGAAPDPASAGISVVAAIVLLVVGGAVFHRVESTMADVV